MDREQRKFGLTVDMPPPPIVRHTTYRQNNNHEKRAGIGLNGFIFQQAPKVSRFDHNISKGQMNSECIYEIINFQKYHRTNLIDFCSERFYRVKFFQR